MAIAGLAVLVRIVASRLIPDQSHLLIDVIDYRESATALFKFGYMVNWYQMPLYPLLIGLAGPGAGQLAADILLSVVLTWSVGSLTFEIFADRSAAFLAAIAAACYPPLIFISVVGLSEPLFIALVFLAFLNWYRGSFTFAAVFSVLAILTRPVFDLFAPCLVLLFAIVVHRQSLRQASFRLLTYVLIYCAIMTPWWISNYHAYGQFVRLTAGGGTALYAGNNPLNRTGGGNLYEDYDLKGFVHLQDRVERDRALTRAAVEFIVDNPGRFLELAWLKFVRIWRPWPVNAGYSSFGVLVATAGSFLPVLILGVVGIFLKRRMVRRLSPIYLFALGYTAVHMVVVGTIRYRLPLEPFLIIFAAVAVSEIWGILVRPQRREPVTH
ncbi:hypothetical protein DXH78_11405 [Undibacter mobilis]|uniref:Glycosyltransferase RgtA/B/C/D-like domain-containing protein n=1 Tax=Undibacter mobilis TaxID=2292256 RepID=A0A371BC13_9BRAD|nr:hypothetical protein DXH78_11405 [Undibacter mobilis]